MKSTIRKLFFILAILMSFVAVQSACAETVTGTIDSITIRPPTIVIDDGTEVSGVRINYLCNQYNICLIDMVGEEVTIEYYKYYCSDGTFILKACKITVGDATIELRSCPEQ